MESVKSKNGIDEWVPGLYDADVTFSYPEGVYSSGVAATASIFVQAEGGVVLQLPENTDTEEGRTDAGTAGGTSED